MDQKKAFKNTLLIVIIGILLYCGIQNYVVFVRLFSFLMNLIFPFILGGCIAFIINVPMRALERILLPNNRKFDSFRRGCAYLLTLILIFGIATIILFVITPQISSTIKLVIAQVPIAFTAFQKWLFDITANIPNVQQYLNNIDVNWSTLSSQVIQFLKSASSTIFSSGIGIISGIIGGVTTFIIAFIFSIYLVFQKEKLSSQTKQTLYATLPEKHSDYIIYIARLSNRIFSNFLSGQCIEACILGSMFFVTLSIFRLPYALLISVIIAVTALIPIFGAFIGCVIGIFLIVMVNPVQAIWFIVIFFVLQQIEGNLIYPHVVGGSIGLPAIWVLVAVTVGGSLFGVAGILLFIPFCSVCYALFRDMVKRRLSKRNIANDKYKSISPDECANIIDAFMEPEEKKEKTKRPCLFHKKTNTPPSPKKK